MLKSISLNSVTMKRVCDVGNLRSTLESFSINNTTTSTLSEVLQCDVLHKSNIEPSQVMKLYSYMNRKIENFTVLGVD